MAKKQTRTRLGIEAENMGRAVADPGIVEMARAIEEAGVDSISVSDHLLSFAPDAVGGRAVRDETWLEALTCLAAMSSVTSHVRLIASVIILPQRNVLELLKTVSTIDYLSGGRLALGVGSGWNEREMAALGYDFASRGKRMDEMLQVLRSARAESLPAFAGAQVAVPPGVVMSPPSFPGHDIPIYIGGSRTSAVSVRRALQYGDGWMPYSPEGRYDSAALQRTLTHLRDARNEAGKEPLDTIYKLDVAGHASPALEREAVELAELGFDEIIVQGIWDAGLDRGRDAIRRVRQALDA